MDDIISFLEANPHIGEYTQSPIEGTQNVRMELLMNDYIEFVKEFCTYIGKDLKWNSIWKRIKRAGFCMEQGRDGAPKGQSRTFVSISDGTAPARRKARSTSSKKNDGDKPKKARKKRKAAEEKFDDEDEVLEYEEELEQMEIEEEQDLGNGEAKGNEKEKEEEEEEEEELDMSLIGNFGLEPQNPDESNPDYEVEQERFFGFERLEGCQLSSVFQRDAVITKIPNEFKANLKVLEQRQQGENKNVQVVPINGKKYKAVPTFILIAEEDPGQTISLPNTNDRNASNHMLLQQIERITK